jgi:hypothetical protein
LSSRQASRAKASEDRLNIQHLFTPSAALAAQHRRWGRERGQDFPTAFETESPFVPAGISKVWKMLGKVIGLLLVTAPCHVE